MKKILIVLLCCSWVNIATAATQPYRCADTLPNAFRTFRFPLGGPLNGDGYVTSGNSWLQFVSKESRVYSCGDQARFFDAYHPAEDWNRVDNQRDYGDPISAAGDGEVVYVENTRPESGWGRLMMIRHAGSLKIPDPDTGADTGQVIGEVWTLYGHMIPDGSDPIHTNPFNPRTGEPWKACDAVKSGEVIGHVGHSRAGDHLHFEVKSQSPVRPTFFPCRREDMSVGSFYSWITSHYLYPTAFINLNRPRHEVSLASVPREGGAAPLEVDFITRVESNLEGETTFTFYCDRPDSGATVTPGWKFRTTTSANPLTHPELHCSYTSPGVYTAKIVAEREGRAAEVRRIITVTRPFCPALFGARAVGVECTTSTTSTTTTSTSTSSSTTTTMVSSTTSSSTTTVTTTTVVVSTTIAPTTTSSTSTTLVSSGGTFRLWHDPLADGTIFPEDTVVVGCDIHATIDHSSGETHCIRDLQIGGTAGLRESSNVILSVLPENGFAQPVTFTIVNVERDDNVDGVGDGVSLIPLPILTKFARFIRSSHTIQPAQYGSLLFQVQLLSADIDGNAGRYIIHLRATSEGIDPPVTADTYLLLTVGHLTTGFTGGYGGPVTEK